MMTKKQFRWFLRAYCVIVAGGMVKFSVPDSTVEIEMMEGRDGNPIRNHSKNKEFSYSETHGPTSKIDTSSKERNPVDPDQNETWPPFGSRD